MTSGQYNFNNLNKSGNTKRQHTCGHWIDPTLKTQVSDNEGGLYMCQYHFASTNKHILQTILCYNLLRCIHQKQSRIFDRVIPTQEKSNKSDFATKYPGFRLMVKDTDFVAKSYFCCEVVLLLQSRTHSFDHPKCISDVNGLCKNGLSKKCKQLIFGKRLCMSQRCIMFHVVFFWFQSTFYRKWSPG